MSEEDKGTYLCMGEVKAYEMKRGEFEKYLCRHGEVMMPIQGTSMLPLLRQGKDLVLIERKKENHRYEEGDVILYRRVEKNQYVLHRIIHVGADDYILLGDNCFSKEYGIRDENILGIMTGFVRSGRYHSVQEKGYEWYREFMLSTTDFCCWWKKHLFFCRQKLKSVGKKWLRR